MANRLSAAFRWRRAERGLSSPQQRSNSEAGPKPARRPTLRELLRTGKSALRPPAPVSTVAVMRVTRGWLGLALVWASWVPGHKAFAASPPKVDFARDIQ